MQHKTAISTIDHLAQIIRALHAFDVQLHTIIGQVIETLEAIRSVEKLGRLEPDGPAN
jgi:hypothetical protein